MFQHFDLMTINVDIADGDPRVGSTFPGIVGGE